MTTNVGEMLAAMNWFNTQSKDEKAKLVLKIGSRAREKITAYYLKNVK